MNLNSWIAIETWGEFYSCQFNDLTRIKTPLIKSLATVVTIGGQFQVRLNTQRISFENLLSEEQINIFHKILDCVSETAAADEMRSAYKVGFKDGAAIMQEIQD